MRIALFILAIVASVPSLTRAQEVQGWRRVTDAGPADSVLHDRMPPGWHITTGPAAILFDPANQARGRFAIEAEIHLFPGDSNEGFGVFLGGSDLDGANSSWTAFLIRKDGSAIVEQRLNNATTTLIPATKSPAIKPHTGAEGTALNQIRVLVQGDSAVFSANGQRVAAIATSCLVRDIHGCDSPSRPKRESMGRCPWLGFMPSVWRLHYFRPSAVRSAHKTSGVSFAESS